MEESMFRSRKIRWQVPAGMVNEAYQHDGGISGAKQVVDIALAIHTTQDNLDNVRDPPRETRENGPEEQTARDPAGSLDALVTEHQERGETSGQAGEGQTPGGDGALTVALGASLTALVVNMVGPCFSVIFSHLLLDLGESSTTISWLYNTMQFIINVSGLFLGNLVAEFGWMKVTLSCSILTSCSVVLSAFATSAWFIFLSNTILGGISLGMMNSLSFLIIPYYFTKRKGLASAIMQVGAISGMMLGPIIVGILQEEFGFFGATIIYGAIALHGCVGASFMRTLKVAVNVQADDVMNHSRSWSSDNILVRVCRDSVHNLAILRSPVAATIAVGHMFTLNSWLNFLALVPFAVQAAGHSSQSGNLCVTVMAASFLVTIVMVSVLSDSPWFNMRACCMISSATIGASTVAFSLVEEIRWQLASSALLGSGAGGYMSVFILVIAHYMGPDNMVPTSGATFLMVGFCFITIGPFTGVIRDASGSYAASMWLLAGLAFASFTAWLFMPIAVRYDQRKSGNARSVGNP